MKAVGEYAGDGVVLLLHGGIFEVEIWGELLGVMGYMLQINQFIHFIFFQLRIVDYLTVFYVGDRVIYSWFMAMLQQFTLLGQQFLPFLFHIAEIHLSLLNPLLKTFEDLIDLVLLLLGLQFAHIC